MQRQIKIELEEEYKKIESIVCNFYKVSADEVYTDRKSKYPYGICKWVLMYILYINGMKACDTAKLFGVSKRIVFRKIAEIDAECKSDTKIKEDIDRINKLLNK